MERTDIEKLVEDQCEFTSGTHRTQFMNGAVALYNAQVKHMKGKYVITSEDGAHYIAEEISDEDKSAAEDGIISILRLSDGKLYDEDDKWIDLTTWGDW